MAPHPTHERPRPARRGGGLTLGGVALIVLGVLLALDNVGVADTGPVIAAWWPIVVVAAGVRRLTRGHRTLGWGAVVVGALLLVTTTGLVALGELLGPLALVALGAVLLLGSTRLRRLGGGSDAPLALLGELTVPDEQPDSAETPTLELDGLVPFGDVKVRRAR